MKEGRECNISISISETTQFNSAKQIVANCPSELASLSPFTSVTSGTPTQSPTLANEWTIIPLEEPSDTFKRKQVNKITLGTHVSLDRLAILEKNLHTWTEPVSLVVFVPVKEIKSGLEDWQRYELEVLFIYFCLLLFLTFWQPFAFCTFCTLLTLCTYIRSKLNSLKLPSDRFILLEFLLKLLFDLSTISPSASSSFCSYWPCLVLLGRVMNRVYIEKKIKSLNLTPESSVTLVLAQETLQDSPGTKFDGSFDSNKKVPFKYPINKLRNLVISNTFTKYILLVDADFAPSGNIESVFHSTISFIGQQVHQQRESAIVNQVTGYQKCNSKCAFIVPAFEWLHPDQVCQLTITCQM